MRRIVLQIIFVIFASTQASREKHKIEEFASPGERQGLLIRNLRSYEIDHPIITDGARSDLGYLTDHLSRRRRKRAINVVGEHEPFHYKFHANGEDYHMELKMNTELFGPNFKVEHFYEDDKVETNKMDEHCYLVGKTLRQNYSVAISDCDGLLGVVTTDEDMIFIEPLVNDSYVDKDKLTGPGRPHLIYKQSELSKLDQRFSHMGITRIAPANKKRSPKRRAYLSYVRFINRSGRVVQLMWIDETSKRRTYFATLIPGTDRFVSTFTTHKWVAVDKETNIDLLVGRKTLFSPPKNTRPTRQAEVYITLPPGKQLRRTTQDEIKKIIGAKYIESMVVADKSVVDFHGKDRAERYIMALMNIVSYVFKHKSLGLDINYVLVRIVLLHKEPKQVTFNVKKPNKSLLTACDYMHKIRKGRTDVDPYYHDHATYLTRKSFGTAAGYAPVYGMCHPVRSCTLNGEDGFPSAFIIAHEVGHSLGMEHDGESNKCGSDTSRGSIMAPLVQSRMNRFFWSSCSRKEVTGSIRNFHCLNDKPGDEHEKDLPYLHKYPGFHYTTDDQCRFDFGDGFKFCRAFYRDPCSVLWCNMPAPYENLCKSMRAPALDGTDCGPKKWCMNGRCIVRNESIKAPEKINGSWSSWQPWESCSKDCGVGFQLRTRQCNNPSPRYGGKDCVGEPTEQKLCNIKKCERTLPLHDDEIKKQCPLIGKQKDRYRAWTYYDESEVNLNCTFEKSLCSWRNVRSSDKYDWRFKRGPTQTKKTGPSVDHTTNTTRGQYIFFESSNPVKRGDTARLSSPDMAVQRGCLTFWYHMYGSENSMGTLRVLKKNKNGEKTLWSKNKNGGDEWVEANLDIKQKGTNVYKLIFESERGNFYLSDIALDDISFTLGSCKKDKSRENTGAVSNPCIVSCASTSGVKRIYPDNAVFDGFRCYDNGSLDVCMEGKCRNVGCDGTLDSEKEYDNCGICGGDNSMCKRNVGKFTRTPRKDFKMLLRMPKGSSNIKVTKLKNPDYMLVLTVTDRKKSKKEIRVINAGGIQSEPGIYYSSGTQYVYQFKDGEESIRSLGQARQHVHIKLKALKKKGTDSPISINYEYYTTREIAAGHKELIVSTQKPDRVKKPKGTTTKKPTEEPKTKAGENKTDVAKEEGPHWVIFDKWTKCSRSCGNGTSFLIYYCQLNKKIVTRAHCKHLVLNVKKKFRYCNTHPCGKTYIWVEGPWGACSKTCSVGLKNRNVTCREKPDNKVVSDKFCKGKKPSVVQTCLVKQCSPVWKTEDWSKCSTTCGVGSQTRNVYCTNGKQRTNGCDEKKKPETRKYCQRSACPTATTDPLDCDFEKDLCQWKQVKDDDHNWIRHRGKTKSSSTGPSSDHTLRNGKGHYIFVEASDHFKHHHKALLISPEVSAKRACLKFYYHMYGSHIGKLKVRLLTKTGYMNGSVWKQHSDQGNKWKEAQVDISLRLSYQIVIEAVLGTGWRGDLAIDDITFYKTECSKSPGTHVAGKVL